MSDFRIATSLAHLTPPNSQWRQVDLSSRACTVDGLGFYKPFEQAETEIISEGALVARAFGAALAIICSLGFACFSYDILQCFNNEDARSYRVIAEYERDLSVGEKIGRGLLGTLALVCSLGLAWLSYDVRNFFDNKATRKIAMLKDEEYDYCNVKDKIKRFLSWDGKTTVAAFRSFCEEMNIKLSFGKIDLFSTIAQHATVPVMQFALASARANSAQQDEISLRESHVIANMIISRLEASKNLEEHTDDPEAYLAETLAMLKLFIPKDLDLKSPAVSLLITADARYKQQSGAAHLLFHFLKDILYKYDERWGRSGLSPLRNVQYDEPALLDEPYIMPYYSIIEFLVEQGDVNEVEIMPFQLKMQHLRGDHPEIVCAERLVAAVRAQIEAKRAAGKGLV